MAPCWLDDDICVWILKVWSIIEDAAHEAFIRFGNHGNVDAVSSDILAGKYSVGDLWVVFVLVFGFQACAQMSILQSVMNINMNMNSIKAELSDEKCSIIM